MNKLSNQEAFNIMVRHLRRQDCASILVNGLGLCAYRGIKGRMCAVGALIPNNIYLDIMEKNPIGDLLKDTNFTELQEFFSELNVSLLMRMQKIHDRADVSHWTEAFAEVAIEYNLTFPND